MIDESYEFIIEFYVHSHVQSLAPLPIGLIISRDTGSVICRFFQTNDATHELMREVGEADQLCVVLVDREAHHAALDSETRLRRRSGFESPAATPDDQKDRTSNRTAIAIGMITIGLFIPCTPCSSAGVSPAAQRGTSPTRWPAHR